MRKAVILLGYCLLGCQDPPAANPEFPSRDELKIVVIHDDQARCVAYAKTSCCLTLKHWVRLVNDVKCADRAPVEAFLKSEAARFKTADPKVSEFGIILFSESGAPYGEVGDLMHQVAVAGIYRVTLGERKTEGKGNAIASPLGVGTNTGVDVVDLTVLVGKRELREHESVRWVDAPKFKETLEDVAKYRRPRREASVLIDPLPSTLWTEVIRLMDTLREMGFERMEFAAPYKGSDLPKK